MDVAVEWLVGARRGRSRRPAGRHHQPDGRPGHRAAHQTRGQWTVFDHVQAGQIIARIDDQQLEASKSLLLRDIKDLHDKLVQEQSAGTTAEGAETSDVVRRAGSLSVCGCRLWNSCCRPHRS